MLKPLPETPAEYESSQDELQRLKEHCERLERQNAELLEREREWASIRQCKREAPDYAREDIESLLTEKKAVTVNAVELPEWINALQAAPINFEIDWIPTEETTRIQRGNKSVRVKCKLRKPYLYSLEVLSIDEVP